MLSNILSSENTQNPFVTIITASIKRDSFILSYIPSTTVYAGGGKIVESKQINNIFYRYKDATEFSDTIIKKRVEPQGLRDIVENYIIESIDRARQSA